MNRNIKFFLLLAFFANVSLVCFGNPNEPIVSVQNGNAMIGLYNTAIATIGVMFGVWCNAYYNRNKKS